MPLDAAQRQKVKDWLAQKCPQRTCQACGDSNWSGGDLVVMRETLPGQVITAQGVRVVPVACDNCGCVTLFAAATIGV
ncbi:MAG TPA: hypothetical protein VKA46_24760 [Gemmataceae bacterium]|nr:hypothetical protein [Gemmataceae bacterium]